MKLIDTKLMLRLFSTQQMLQDKMKIGLATKRILILFDIVYKIG